MENAAAPSPPAPPGTSKFTDRPASDAACPSGECKHQIQTREIALINKFILLMESKLDLSALIQSLRERRGWQIHGVHEGHRARRDRLAGPSRGSRPR